MCTACRTRKTKFELLRVVKTVGKNTPVLDLQFKLQGRGAYICKNGDCAKKAQKIKAFERALTCSTTEEFWQKLALALQEI